ncbi:uncharacterized protein [Heptranchias perlo]|uniref:uncharacterized protein n=1 Tax=Heptranchias perlo TaxID=212740 RepID=UPI00355ACBF0
MWRSGARVSRLLLAFCLCGLGSLHGQELNELSRPMNLSVKFDNFQTVLKWDVANASRTLRFSVDSRDYNSGQWKPFLPCLNISTHHCDLSEAFEPTLDPVNSYYARVKVVTMSQESEFASTDRFSFSDNATLGPPTVHVTADGNEIRVKVMFVVPNSKAGSIKKAIRSLSYNIYYWKRETPKLENKIDCSKPCTFQKIAVTEGVTCVSAEARLDKLKLKGKRSQEICLPIQSSNISDSRMLAWSPTLRREGYITPQTVELDYSGKEGDEDGAYGEDYPGGEDGAYGEDYPGGEYGEDYPGGEDGAYGEDYPGGEECLEKMCTEEDEDPKDPSVKLDLGAASKLQPDNSESSRASKVAVLATGGVVIIVLLVFAIACAVHKIKKKQLVLPKSLVHIIMGRNVYTNVYAKTEESSICKVTTLEAVTHVCEVDPSDETQVEMIKASSDNVDVDPINADVGESESVNVDLIDPYAAKIGIRGTDQKTVSEDNIEVCNGDPASIADLCKTNSDNAKQIFAADNWGYDKPQIPFDMFLNNCTGSVN